jgi:hypothetical protein
LVSSSAASPSLAKIVVVYLLIALAQEQLPGDGGAGQALGHQGQY